MKLTRVCITVILGGAGCCRACGWNINDAVLDARRRRRSEHVKNLKLNALHRKHG